MRSALDVTCMPTLFAMRGCRTCFSWVLWVRGLGTNVRRDMSFAWSVIKIGRRNLYKKHQDKVVYFFSELIRDQRPAIDLLRQRRHVRLFRSSQPLLGAQRRSGSTRSASACSFFWRLSSSCYSVSSLRRSSVSVDVFSLAGSVSADR